MGRGQDEEETGEESDGTGQSGAKEKRIGDQEVQSDGAELDGEGHDTEKARRCIETRKAEMGGNLCAGERKRCAQRRE